MLNVEKPPVMSAPNGQNQGARSPQKYSPGVRQSAKASLYSLAHNLATDIAAMSSHARLSSDSIRILDARISEILDVPEFAATAPAKNTLCAALRDKPQIVSHLSPQTQAMLINKSQDQLSWGQSQMRSGYSYESLLQTVAHYVLEDPKARSIRRVG